MVPVVVVVVEVTKASLFGAADVCVPIASDCQCMFFSLSVSHNYYYFSSLMQQSHKKAQKKQIIPLVDIIKIIFKFSSSSIQVTK